MTGVLAVMAAGGGFTVKLVPPSVDEVGAGANVTTAAIQCVVTPSGAYTYQWINLGGGDITALSPTSSTSAFRGSLMFSGEVRETNYICRVTQGAIVVDSPFAYVRVERT